MRHFYLFHDIKPSVTSSGVEERLPWRGRPHGHPDGRLWLHHCVRAERAIGRMLAEHVQAAQLLLSHLRSHWNPGEELPRELPPRWESAVCQLLMTIIYPTHDVPFLLPLAVLHCLYILPNIIFWSHTSLFSILLLLHLCSALQTLLLHLSYPLTWTIAALFIKLSNYFDMFSFFFSFITIFSPYSTIVCILRKRIAFTG